MIFLGDTHGDWVIVPDKAIGVGDHGIGFKGAFPPNFRFIRGNHDNPEVCTWTRGFLGDFGVRTWGGKRWGFVSGGFSVDRNLRTEGVDWWPDEELTFAQTSDCFDLLLQQPIYGMISHEAPGFIVDNLVQRPFPTFTSQFLDALWQHLKPKVWVFGHYHKSFDKDIEGTRFKGLNLNELWDSNW